MKTEGKDGMSGKGVMGRRGKEKKEIDEMTNIPLPHSFLIQTAQWLLLVAQFMS